MGRRIQGLVRTDENRSIAPKERCESLLGERPDLRDDLAASYQLPLLAHTLDKDGDRVGHVEPRGSLSSWEGWH